MANYVGDFLTGFGEGIENATNRALNGITIGALDRINPEAVKLKEDLQQRADETGVGGAQATINALSEIGGGLLPASKALKVAELAGLTGVRALMGAGALEEGLRGAIKSKNLSDVPANALTDATIGAITSGSVGFAMKSLIGAANIMRSDVGKGIVYLKDKLGSDELNKIITEAREKGRSLVEVVEQKALNLLDKARLQTEPAGDIIDKNVKALVQKTADNADDVLDKTFTTAQGWKTAEEVKEAADHASGRIFKGLYALGDITKRSPDLLNFIKNNDLVKYAIRQVKNDVTVPKEIRKLPFGDMQILERARQRINDMASKAFNMGNKSQIKDITEAKNAFLGEMYKAVPEYDRALRIYEQAHRLREAVDSGVRVFKRSVNPEKFAEDFNKLESYEKDAMKLGLKDKIYEILGNTKNTGGWRALTLKNVQKKIKTVLGEEEGSKLIDFAEQEIKKNDNLNKLLGGSKTAEKQIKKVPFSWINTAIELANTMGDVGRKSRNVGIAKIMTSPTSEVAEKALKSLDNPIDKLLMRYMNATPEISALANYLAKESKL